MNERVDLHLSFSFFSLLGRKQLTLFLQSVTLDYCPDRLMSSFHGLFFLWSVHLSWMISKQCQLFGTMSSHIVQMMARSVDNGSEVLCQRKQFRSFSLHRGYPPHICKWGRGYLLYIELCWVSKQSNVSGSCFTLTGFPFRMGCWLLPVNL